MSNLGFFYDPTSLLLLPVLILSMYAQFKVSSTFNKYSKVANRKGLTGADVAKQILERAGIFDVSIEQIAGSLTDHYDPAAKVLRLSAPVYGSTSISALGVAAHEAGHAIQHSEGYTALTMRNSIVPVVNIGSKLAMPLIFLGIFLSSGSGELGMLMLRIGIILYAGIVVFHGITLPVEFNASNRAIALLGDYNFLSDDELKQSKKVLNAAALTYIAAALTAVLNIIRFLMLANSRKRD